MDGVDQDDEELSITELIATFRNKLGGDASKNPLAVSNIARHITRLYGGAKGLVVWYQVSNIASMEALLTELVDTDPHMEVGFSEFERLPTFSRTV